MTKITQKLIQKLDDAAERIAAAMMNHYETTDEHIGVESDFFASEAGEMFGLDVEQAEELFERVDNLDLVELKDGDALLLKDAVDELLQYLVDINYFK
jgi:hypothetical protein